MAVELVERIIAVEHDDVIGRSDELWSRRLRVLAEDRHPHFVERLDHGGQDARGGVITGAHDACVGGRDRAQHGGRELRATRVARAEKEHRRRPLGCALDPQQGFQPVVGELRRQSTRMLRRVVEVPVAAQTVDHDFAHLLMPESTRVLADEPVGDALDDGKSIRRLYRHRTAPRRLEPPLNRRPRDQ